MVMGDCYIEGCTGNRYLLSGSHECKVPHAYVAGCSRHERRSQIACKEEVDEPTFDMCQVLKNKRDCRQSLGLVSMRSCGNCWV